VDAALEKSERGFARPLIRTAQGISASHAVWASTFIAAVVWTVVADIRESLFIGRRQDLGNFTQAVWTTAHGHFLQVTEAGGTEVSRLGIHADPIIAAFAPLWWLWPSPLLLLTVQAIGMAAGAIPLFWLGQKHLPREREAALLAVAYLLCPTVGWIVVSDFHTVSLAVPLLLFAIWYLDEDRLVLFAATAGAAMLCQEQIGFMVGCLGLWYMWRRRRFAAGLTIAAAGLAVSAVDFFVVLRHFSGGSPYAARFGGSPGTLLRDFFTDPLRLARQINGHDLSGLLPAVPVLGVCFRSTILLAALPQIALLLISRRANDWDWFGVNVLLLIPFIYAATTFAVAGAARRKPRNEPNLLVLWLFAASLVVAVAAGPFGALSAPTLFRHSASISAQRRAVSLVPADARVSATNHLALPLAARRYLYVFPVLKDADWVLVDSHDDDLPSMSYIHRRLGIDVGVSDLYRQPNLMRRALRHLMRSPTWRLVYRRDDIYAFRRSRAGTAQATARSST
jgi:uncharacterized membrane protein